MTFRPVEATLFLEKTEAPTVDNDQNDGYLVGDIWVDQTNDAAYLNLDVTVGAAVWKHISLEEAAIDHGSILGLEGNDHPHYALLTDLAAEGGADLIGHHTLDAAVHTVREMIEHITPSWLMSGGVISDTGGLNIQWTKGSVFNESNGIVYEFDARGTDLALTDSNVNYLYWNGTTRSTTLAVATSRPAHPDVTIGHAHCQDGDIWGTHQNYYAGRNAREYWLGLRSTFPSIITSGMIVSEDVDATNALDVKQTAGVYYEAVHDRVVGAEILSRTAPLMKRWFRNGGVWDHANNAEIDTAQYDNGTDLANIPANRYVKTVFFTDGTYIHWVYATETFVKKTDALKANTPTLPPGLAHLPKTTALMYQEGDVALPTDVDNWIDVRPTISPAEGAGIVTSHLNLIDIGTTTHASIDTHIADTGLHFDEIDELSDVVISGPVDNDLLQYDDGTSKWVDRTLAEAGISAAGHTHDSRYFTEAEHLNVSAGAGDAGKPIKLDAAGRINTTMLKAIIGDVTTGRVLRVVQLKIEDGTNASTLKCTLINTWNGDTIAVTDNVAKNATTGHWTLDVNGQFLVIENGGLTGTVVAVVSSNVQYNVTGIVSNGLTRMLSDDIEFSMWEDGTGAVQDLTSIIDTTKQIQVSIAYLTTE